MSIRSVVIFIIIIGTNAISANFGYKVGKIVSNSNWIGCIGPGEVVKRELFDCIGEKL